jgi:hypothetical protein
MAMGIGRLGRPDIIFKRKFRWTLQVAGPWGFVPEHYVKLAARPKLTVEDTEVNFLNQTTWIPGKAKWEPISVSWYDVASKDMGDLWSWIATVYNFNSSNITMSEKAGWNGTALITMYDGCGSALEQWTLGSVWPMSADFGSLDYSSGDLAEIELQLRYSDVTYEGICGPSPKGQCKGC